MSDLSVPQCEQNPITCTHSGCYDSVDTKCNFHVENGKNIELPVHSVMSNVQQCDTSVYNDHTIPDVQSNDVQAGARVNIAGVGSLNNYVSLAVPNFRFFAMVDCGADVSCVNPNMLKQHSELQKYQVYQPDLDYIETATGDRTPVIGMIFMKPKLDNQIVHCRFYVVPNVQPSFILGKDFLNEHQANLQFGTDGTINMSINPVRQVVAASTVTVPPKSQVAFIARIKGKPLPNRVVGLTSGSPNLYHLGLLPTKSLSINVQGQVQFACANFGDEPVFIGRSENLGKFTCLSQGYNVHEIPDVEDNECVSPKCKQMSNMSNVYLHDMSVQPEVQMQSVPVKSCGEIHNTGHDSALIASVDGVHSSATSTNTGMPGTERVITTIHDNCISPDMNQPYQPPHMVTQMVHVSDNSNCIPNVPMSQKLDFTESTLTQDQQHQVMQIVDKYDHVFVGSDNKLGKCDMLQHRITIDAKHKPIRQRAYRLGPKQKQVLEHMIHDMEEQDIIQPSTSPWAAPCLLVAKPNNKGYRFVVDFRGINQLIELEATPLPTTEEALDSIGAAKPVYFTTLDLQSGFYQVVLDPESRHYTAFRCHLGLYQFKRLPMGLKNSPATFQRLMEAVLHGLTWKHCLVYMDDIILYSQDFDTHMRHLEAVFQRLAQAGLKLRPDKCQFALPHIQYLGHILSADGISPSPDKIKAVQDYPTPKTVKDLRAFLGLSGYYRKFVQSYASISAPLYALTKKGAIFQWSTACEEAFEKLKTALTSPPLLAFPDFNRPFKLYTDASSFAVGGVLAQDTDGVEHVICYLGRSLTASERNYGITEKECLALVYCVRKLDCYLRYSAFEAVVDHSALQWLFALKEPTGKFARWVTLLQAYSMNIVHRPGKAHSNADGISRREYLPSPTDNGVNEFLQLLGPDYDFDQSPPKSAVRVIQAPPKTPTTHPKLQEQANNLSPTTAELFQVHNLAAQQQQDSTYANLIEFLRSGTLNDGSESQHLVRMAKEFFLHDGVLYHVWVKPGRGHRVDRSFVQIAVPQSLVKSVLQEYHDSPLAGGHLGISRTIDKVRVKFYWPNMYSDIVNWVKSCVPCNQRKNPALKVRAQVTPMPVPSMPFERVSTDILGPLPQCVDTGNKYVLVFVDYFSKYIELIPLPDIKAATVAKAFLREIVCRHGAPRYLHSDRGSNYLSHIVRITCQLMQTKKTQAVSYHPQCNGQSERCMSYILASLAKQLDGFHTQWDQFLPFTQFVYNTSPSLDSTEYTPAFLVYGRHLRTPLDHVAPFPQSCPKSAQHYVGELIPLLEAARLEAEQTLKDRKLLMQQQCAKQAKNDTFHVGDTVYLHSPVLGHDQSKKLASAWQGPYYVIEKLSNVHVRLRSVHTSQLYPQKSAY